MQNTLSETKLLTSPIKAVTPWALRPTGCYCDKVHRRCGVCARTPGLKDAVKARGPVA